MQTAAGRRPHAHRVSRPRHRPAILAAALLIALAQMAPAAAFAAPGDGTIAATLATPAMEPGAAGTVDVAVTCPDMGADGAGATELVGAVFVGADTLLSETVSLETAGTWTGDVLVAAIPFVAPADAGTYDLLVRVTGRACVDGSTPAAVSPQLVVEAPAAPPAPADPEPAPAADPPVVAAETQVIAFDVVPVTPRVGDTGESVHATAMTTITYSSSDPGICTVDPSTGALALLDAGTCTIVADAAADATYEAAQASESFDVWPAVRDCRSYTGATFVGAVVLNPDGTPIGCGTTAGEGAPADLHPDGWAADWDSWYGPSNEIAYAQRLGYECDDCWIGMDGEDGDVGLPIGFPINFYGTEYSTVFVNSNGSISFGSGSDEYDYPLDQILDGAAGVVAFGLDLDNREITDSGSPWGTGRHGDFFYWGRTTFGGHDAFVATWMNIQSYRASVSKTDWNTFQVMLVDIDDGAGTDVDIIVNYGSIQANDEGYSDGCADPDGGCVAIGVGSVLDGNIMYASIVDDDGVLYNGLTSAVVADDGAFPLNVGHLNSAIPGRFKFQMRDGDVPQTATVPGAPVITSAVKGDTEATIGWNPPAVLGGSPILSYQLRWRPMGSSDAWNTDSSSGSPYTITGLVNGTTYQVQVAATNGTGTGAWSVAAYVTPGAAGSPEWVDTVIGPLYRAVPFSGGVSADGSPAPTYAITGGALPAGLVLDATTGAITGTPTATGFYDVTITASNDAGSAAWRFTGAVESLDVPQTDTVASVAPSHSDDGGIALLFGLIAASLGAFFVVSRLRTQKVRSRRQA